MRIYLAGGQLGWREQLEGHHLLVSYAEPQQLRLLTAGWDVPGYYLDSGAFTVWRQGRAIDLAAYVEFIKRHEHLLAGYIALDVIPGEPGRMPTEEEAKIATDKTMANLDLMRVAGLKPIPVYHEGEPIEVLDEYVRQGHDLIALGGTASRGRPEMVDWLLPLFERFPEQKFHGLAMTQARIIRHLPFYSVDSTSWLNFARYGVESNTYLLKGRSQGFNRALGIAALEDIARCPEGTPATRDGQLRMFPADRWEGEETADGQAS